MLIELIFDQERLQWPGHVICSIQYHHLYSFSSSTTQSSCPLLNTGVNLLLSPRRLFIHLTCYTPFTLIYIIHNLGKVMFNICHITNQYLTASLYHQPMLPRLSISIYHVGLSWHIIPQSLPYRAYFTWFDVFHFHLLFSAHLDYDSLRYSSFSSIDLIFIIDHCFFILFTQFTLPFNFDLTSLLFDI